MAMYVSPKAKDVFPRSVVGEENECRKIIILVPGMMLIDHNDDEELKKIVLEYAEIMGEQIKKSFIESIENKTFVELSSENMKSLYGALPDANR